MTIPTVTSVTKSSSASASTTFTVNYPASDISSGDLLLLLIVNDANGATSLPIFAGDYATNELLSEYAPTAGDLSLGVSYIVADGTENGGSVNVTCAFSETFAANMIHITGWDSSTSLEIGARSSGTNNDTGAVSLNPSGWDSSSEDTLWVWFHGGDQNTGANVDTFPPEMPDNQNNNTEAGSPNSALATDDTSTSTRSVSAQTNNLALFDQHVELLIGVRGASASTSDINYTGTGRGILRGLARGVG